MVIASPLPVASERRWRPPTLAQLVRSLDLWGDGTSRYLLRAADAEWPSVPGAQLVAGAVVAAERALPGCGVRLAAWTPGAAPDARRPVRLVVDGVRRGLKGEVSAEVIVTQRSAAGRPEQPYGRAVMILADGPGGLVAGLPAAKPARPGPARPGSALPGPALPGAGRRPTPSGVVPPALAALLAPGSSAGDPDLPPGGTLHRALLAYLGEALAVPTGISAYPMDAPSARVATLAYSVAFLAPVDLRHGLRLADSDSTASAAGPAGTYAHTIARFGAPDGTPLARVSHALQVNAVRPYPREFPQRFR